MISARALHDALLGAYGPQGWWPADDPFEIMVGALLVQRTTWGNTAAAIAALKAQRLLTPAALASADPLEVERCCRVAGFFRSKAARIRQLAVFLSEHTSLTELRGCDTGGLRGTLLRLDGIGAETADAILLYAFGRPAVVVDEYLRRLYQRLTAAPARLPDASIRRWIEADMLDTGELNELHALVVAHGKSVCRKKPGCRECRLAERCRTGRAGSDPELRERVGDFAQDS